MSYNLAFWVGADDQDPTGVYAQLAAGSHVDGVEAVNRDRMQQVILEGLPGWSWDGSLLQPPGADPDGVPAFDVSLGEQLIEFIGYGFTNESANAIIDVMHRLGYRLYDPQVAERFA